MKAPKMIIFDYGQTLCTESGHSMLAGYEAVMCHATENPQNLTAQQVCDFATELFFQTRTAQLSAYEFHQFHFQRLCNEYLQLEFDLTETEFETLLWDKAAPAAATPHIGELLQYLQNRGIRTAVISNLSFSGASLRARLNRLLPDNRFEFVIASSEYTIRKPHKLLFELALRKAHLDGADVWYCGDRVEADIEGAHSAGMYPVWYTGAGLDGFGSNRNDREPNCEHLHITDWTEFIEILESAT
ncbi:MAG: HAD family hydrolase [Oscillospiraceae bacterium]|jgi:putative hydrolase of the HAD superfamily|nr:HAD family hydrolase [Oscillospiraceae bacterium]